MKTIFLLTFFLVLGIRSYSQQNDLSQALLYREYHRKSINQKQAAWFTLGGGVIMIIAGAAIVASEGVFTENETATILPLVGTGTALCSIPLFILSAKNKRKATSIYIENKPVSTIQQNPNSLILTPALTFKIVF